jgi:hypothetical protein
MSSINKADIREKAEDKNYGVKQAVRGGKEIYVQMRKAFQQHLLRNATGNGILLRTV